MNYLQIKCIFYATEFQGKLIEQWQKLILLTRRRETTVDNIARKIFEEYGLKPVRRI